MFGKFHNLNHLVPGLFLLEVLLITKWTLFVIHVFRFLFILESVFNSLCHLRNLSILSKFFNLLAHSYLWHFLTAFFLCERSIVMALFHSWFNNFNLFSLLKVFSNIHWNFFFWFISYLEECCWIPTYFLNFPNVFLLFPL